MSKLEVNDRFGDDGYLEFVLTDDYGDLYDWLTVNQVKNLMSHLQRALDEYGERNE